MQNAYGSIYQANVNVEKTSAVNPKPETVEKIQMQEQLRIDLEHESSGASIVLIKLTVMT